VKATHENVPGNFRVPATLHLRLAGIENATYPRDRRKGRGGSYLLGTESDKRSAILSLFKPIRKAGKTKIFSHTFLQNLATHGKKLTTGKGKTAKGREEEVDIKS